VDSITMSFRSTPFSNIRIIIDAFPNSITLLYTLIPFSIIDFSVFPSVDSFAMSFSIFELSEVSIVSGIPFKTFSVS
jgi:hypothetical protein